MEERGRPAEKDWDLAYANAKIMYHEHVSMHDMYHCDMNEYYFVYPLKKHCGPPYNLICSNGLLSNWGVALCGESDWTNHDAIWCNSITMSLAGETGCNLYLSDSYYDA